MPIWSVYCATPVPKRGGGRGCTVFWFSCCAFIASASLIRSGGEPNEIKAFGAQSVILFFLICLTCLLCVLFFCCCSFFLFQLVLFWRVVGYSAGGLIPIRQSAPAKRRVKERGDLRMMEVEWNSSKGSYSLSLSVCIYIVWIPTRKTWSPMAFGRRRRWRRKGRENTSKAERTTEQLSIWKGIKAKVSKAHRT